MQTWTLAARLRTEGVDVRAVTVWALFGLVDWDSMLREQSNYYEPGAFDTMHPEPRPTLLAQAVNSLAQTGTFAHPALLQSRWWERDEQVHETLRRA